VWGSEGRLYPITPDYVQRTTSSTLYSFVHMYGAVVSGSYSLGTQVPRRRGGPATDAAHQHLATSRRKCAGPPAGRCFRQCPLLSQGKRRLPNSSSPHFDLAEILTTSNEWPWCFLLERLSALSSRAHDAGLARVVQLAHNFWQSL
jgi:hypothetical protein